MTGDLTLAADRLFFMRRAPVGASSAYYRVSLTGKMDERRDRNEC